MSRVQKSRQTEKAVEEDAPAEATTAETDIDITDIIDEIDAVLEKNAEQFVQNYIQKGGQ